MHVTHDKEVRAIYVYLEVGEIDETVELDCPGLMVNVDIDKNGKPLGVEILYPK